MTNSSPFAKDFSKAIRNALARKGIAIIGARNLPGLDGSFANGERGYVLDDNGCHRIRVYRDVVAMAGVS